MSPDATNRRLPLRTLIGFPLANFGPTLQNCIQMYFLLYFFTNVLGISGTAAAIVILVARIWDFINDPVMGILVEKTKRPDKCLFWIRASTVPVAIFMVLTYTAPHFSTTGKVIWAVLTFIGLGMSQTAYSIPMNTLRPMLTTDKAERNRLNTFESAFGIAANLIVPAVTMPLVAWLQGFPVSAPFMVLAMIYAVVYLLTSFVGQRMLRGSEHDEIADTSSGAKIGAGQMLKALLTNKVALLVLLLQVVKMLVSSTAGACMVYYYQYNIQNLDAMSIMSTIGAVVGLLPVLFLVPLYKKFGNAGTALLGCCIALAAMVTRFLTHDSSLGIIYSMTAVESIGIQLVTALMVQCLMDSIDYGEWKTGNKPIAVLMSAYGIGTKVGLAFGATIAGLVTDALHFDPSAAVQSEGVLSSFFNINVGLPMLMYLCMGLVFVYLKKIEKRLPQMRAEVEARKQSATKEIG